MDKIRIHGGRPLEGTIAVGGAKNAALPIMAASLLTAEPLRLKNVPDLADIASMRRLLATLGVAAGGDADGDGPGALTLEAREVTDSTADYDLVRKMRASILVLGPLVARHGEARVSLPGGCAIGPRPVDLHLKGLQELGARIELREGYIHATAPEGGLRGATIRLPLPSVGATENLLMAAALADGRTVIANAALEPEVTDLARCLVAMGARIDGIGTAALVIDGVPLLHGAEHAVLPDRIEAGTYALAAGITGGQVELTGMSLELFGAVADKLGEAGLEVVPTERGVRVSADGKLRGADVMTEPYPGFPTDLQAQFMALMCVADGAAMITETIFENRFMHVPELARMGARITVHGGSALVRGVSRLTGAPLMATDLRASVSLILAGLAAEGETVVHRVYHLDRGYERLEQKLAACGAGIERLP